MTFLGASIRAGPPVTSLPRVSDDSATGVITGVRIGTVAGVLADGMTIGF